VTNQTLTLAELAGGVEQVLQAVAEQQVVVTVLLPSGKEVVIELKAGLQPLPELEGRVAEGWKEALYARS
jgi:hypothetical protein